MAPSDRRIKAVDIHLLDELFEMGSGYVLDFNNRTYGDFFRDEIGVNIDLDRYCAEGDSKAKRLRYFLRTSQPPLIVKTLLALWEYREALRRRSQQEETMPESVEEFWELIERLGGKRPTPKRKPKASAQVDHVVPDEAASATLSQALMRVSQLGAQERGFAFERFLRDLFEAHGLLPRAAFRLRGEQIDGSFVVDGETYLLEARWRSNQADASALRSFNGKVEEKAAWSRGLLISESGFSEDGLHAFGRGKRLVCMDGLDLYDLLDRRLPFAEVLARKVRTAAETGQVFVRVKDLF